MDDPWPSGEALLKHVYSSEGGLDASHERV